MADSPDSVGYKKPPRHSQFKSGTSGNAKGRPKGSRNFATVMEQELSTAIEVTENGRRRRISKRHAIVKQTVNRAVTGDPKATSILLNEARIHENQNAFQGSPSIVTGPEDQMVIENIMRRIRQSEIPSDPESAPKVARVDQSAVPTNPTQGEF
jgi:Family of unknown function (DUF5681)